MYNLPVYCTLIQYLQTDWPQHAGKGESDRKIVTSDCLTLLSLQRETVSSDECVLCIYSKCSIRVVNNSIRSNNNDTNKNIENCVISKDT